METNTLARKETAHSARCLDSGFYIVSDATAGALVRVIGQKLPKLGWEKFVMLELTATDGLKYRVNAWLKRTDLRSSCRPEFASKRGWRWALNGIRRDSGEYLPGLGQSFRFVPTDSTFDRMRGAEFHAVTS